MSNTNSAIADSPSTTAKRSVAPDLALPTLELPQDLSDRINEVWQTLQHALTDDVRSTAQRLGNDFRNNLGSNPSDILTTALTAILDVLEGVGDIAIDVFTAIFDGLIELFRGLIEALWNAAKAEITIPFVSDLFTWATGRKLTTLNLLTLIAAVPVVLVEKLLGTQLFQPESRQQKRTIVDASARLEFVAGTLQGVFGAITGFANAIAVSISYGTGIGYQQFGAPGGDVELKKFRLWLNSLGGTVTRLGLLAAALSSAAGNAGKSGAAFGLWTVPTLALIVDTGVIFAVDEFGDLKLVPSAIAFILSVVLLALVLVFGHRKLIDPKNVAGDIFYALIAAALFSRILFLIADGLRQDPETQAVAYVLARYAVLIGSGFVGLSGVVKFIDGAVKTIKSH